MWRSHLWGRLELPGLKLRLEPVAGSRHSKLLRMRPKLSSLLEPHHVLLRLLCLSSLGHGHCKVVEPSLSTGSTHAHARHAPVHGWEHISKGSPRERLQTTPGHHLLPKVSLGELLLQVVLAQHHPASRAALQKQTTALLVHSKVHNWRGGRRCWSLKPRSGVGASSTVPWTLLPVVGQKQEASGRRWWGLVKARGTSSREHNLATMLLLGEHHVDVVVAKTRWRLLACVTTNQ